MLRRLIPNRFASSATASLASLPRMATARATAASSSSLDTLLTGTNAQWLDSMFEDWAREPASVSPAFAAFFKQVAAGGAAPMGSTATSSAATASSSAAGGGDAPVCKGKRWLSAFQNSTTREAQKALSMILEFETSGHTRANLDPLGHADKEPHRSPLSKRKIGLAPDHLGLSDADLNMLVPVGFCDNLGGIFQATTPTMSMRDLHAYLSKVYTGNIGWEFMHINNFEVCKWLRNRIEVQQPEPVDNKAILSDLADAGAFETFLHRKYNVTKRFGIEGGESLIPGLRALINRSVDRHGAKKFVLGMAHRGRLNVLTNVCGKPVRAIFKEFDSITPEELPDDGRQGDVKYHLGWRSEGLKSRERGLPYRMQLMFNPSHLEAVNPIVQGFTRCLQDMNAGNGIASTIPITIHGDAAYAGQGVVYEDHVVSELPKYTTGGTIHIVINNQVGYTTNPADSRSSQHASDIARCFECPIFHVNGDCPEDVVRVFNLAADFRATFNQSVCIDFVCYRRRGHNEGDDPSMTQPSMYAQIAKMPPVFDLYKAALVAQGVVQDERASDMFEERVDYFKTEKEEANKFDYKSFLTDAPMNWEQHMPRSASDAGMPAVTGISSELYGRMSQALVRFPDGFAPGPKMETIYAQRAAALKEGSVDYATAEALAIGSLLSEGYSFRISGQDVQRGTFSHRHYVVHDEKTGAKHCPLLEWNRSLVPAGTPPHVAPLFSVTNSALSEYAVMGYDAGYSLVSPKRITMWEAQFGDFVNGAQVIIDQYLTSGFTKWGLQYSAIISLPHGYDGQGPEHSSARMERVLQLVAEDELTPDFASDAAQHWANNIEVIVPSTSQSYFHMLRRFAHRNFRRPTFVFFSKSRLKERTSVLAEFTDGSQFLPVIPDSVAAAATGGDGGDGQVRRVVMCQGQLYFDIVAQVQARKLTDTAVVRIEQLAPFPRMALAEQLRRYPASADLVWAQMEPMNMGAWQYLEPRFEHVLAGSSSSPSAAAPRAVRFAGRAYSASPATGSPWIHKLEQEEIFKTIFATPVA